MADERPKLAASEIEEELLRELQKLPTLHDTQSVRIRPYSGPKSKSVTWELDKNSRLEMMIGEMAGAVSQCCASAIPRQTFGGYANASAVIRTAPGRLTNSRPTPIQTPGDGQVKRQEQVGQPPHAHRRPARGAGSAFAQGPAAAKKITAETPQGFKGLARRWGR